MANPLRRRLLSPFAEGIEASCGCLVCLAMLVAGSSFGAAGAPPVGAREAAMGGVSVVGGTRSSLGVCGSSARGLLLQSSWCNPYGIEGLQVAELSFLRLWSKTGVRLLMRALSTPTPYNEVHFLGAVSLAAAEGVAIETGLGSRSLRDSEGTFARESAALIGLVLGKPESCQIGCSVLTPISSGEAPASGAGRHNEGFFRWGVGLPLGERLTLFVEEHRYSHVSTRRLGAELRLLCGVALRGGMTDSPHTVSLGIGAGRDKTFFDLAVAQHEVLGVTPYLTISYNTLRARDSGVESAQ